MSASEFSGAVAPVGLPAGESTGPVAAAPTRDAAEAPRPEDIARWVREAGWSGMFTEWSEPTGDAKWNPVKSQLTVPVTAEQIERFAAAAYAAGGAARVEACADLCKYVYTEVLDDREGIAKLCEEYIRGLA